MDQHRELEREAMDHLLAAQDPVRGLTLDADSLDSALDNLGVAIADSPRPRAGNVHSRRLPARRRLLVTLVAAGVIVTSVGGVAVAALTARTGRFQPTAEQIAVAGPVEAERMQSDLAMGGPGELLNPAASDFGAVALQVAADIPYPQGFESWRDFLIARETMAGESNVLLSEGALRGWFAGSAFVAWVHSWHQAMVAGDEAVAEQAAEMIAGAPGWSAVMALDPRPNPLAPRDGDAVGTLFGWMLPYCEAVAAGDVSHVEQLLSTGYGNHAYVADPKWNAELAEHHPEWSTLSPTALAERYMELLNAGRLAPETSK
ncbi:MAG: hypothetical protein GX604_07175 [Actinobacteria bacterium]|nr:hypothetical protein [Actinomycetota bacterium]